MQARNKITSAAQLQALRAVWRQQQARVVFTNGCFDLLHVGHVRYLEAARDLGDMLVVGVNSDRSVSQIKGPLRPLVAQEQRSEILAALQCVDYVIVFDSPDPLELIELLQPDVLVKGADWPVEQIVGAAEVEHWGGRVVQIPVVPDSSTTQIIERVLERYGGTISGNE